MLNCKLPRTMRAYHQCVQFIALRRSHKDDCTWCWSGKAHLPEATIATSQKICFFFPATCQTVHRIELSLMAMRMIPHPGPSANLNHCVELYFAGRMIQQRYHFCLELLGCRPDILELPPLLRELLLSRRGFRASSLGLHPLRSGLGSGIRRILLSGARHSLCFPQAVTTKSVVLLLQT